MNENKGEFPSLKSVSTMRFEISEIHDMNTNTRTHQHIWWTKEEKKGRETLEEKEEKSIFSIYAFSIIMDTKC